MAIVTVGLSALSLDGRAMGAAAPEASAARLAPDLPSDSQAIARTDCSATSSVRLRHGNVVLRAATVCSSLHTLTLQARIYLVKGGAPGPWVAAADGVSQSAHHARLLHKVVRIACLPGRNSYVVHTKSTAVSRHDGKKHKAETQSLATFRC
jgi:hypothetical protein